MRTTTQSFTLFFGVLVMMACAFFTSILLKDVAQLLVITKGNPSAIPYLASLSPFFGGAIALILALASLHGRVSRAFHLFFPVHIFVLAIYALTINQVESELLIQIFAIWSYLSFVLVPVLIWGFANQHFHFKSAAISYPIIAGIAAQMLIPAGIFLIWSSNLEGSNPMLIGTAASVSLLLYMTFLLLNRVNLGPKEGGREVNWVYWLSLAALLFGLKLGPKLVDIPFKMYLKEVYSTSSTYSQFMGTYSFLRGLTHFYTAFLGIGVGVILYLRGPKIWGAIATIFTFLTIGVGGAYFYKALTGVPNEEGAQLLSWGHIAIASLIMIMMGLKELAYFGIPLEKRFTAKLVIDVISLVLIVPLTAFITITLGTVLVITPYLGALFTFGLMIALVGIFKLGRDLKKAPPILSL